MKHRNLKETLEHLRAMNAAQVAPEPTDAQNEEVADLQDMEGFAAEPEDPSDPHHHAAPDLAPVLAALTPGRAYSAHAGPSWAAEREAHPHHKAAHALGAILGRLGVVASHHFNKPLAHHHRRVLAHFLHGAAHHVHPGNE